MVEGKMSIFDIMVQYKIFAVLKVFSFHWTGYKKI